MAADADDGRLTDGGARVGVYYVGAAITAERVRLIGADGAQLGVVELAEALRLAAEAGLDLVEINDRANPPFCKVMDRFRLEDPFVRSAFARHRHPRGVT